MINDMTENLPRLRDQILSNSATSKVQLTEHALRAIRDWHVQINADDEKLLTHEGEDEMLNLAERMQLRYPTILSDIYSNTSYKFKYTATQRAEQSAKYFASGLFGRDTSSAVWYPAPLHKDPVLRFYKLCNKWRKTVKKNATALYERTQFIQGPIVGALLEEISAKLGFKTVLNFDDLYTMYMTCAFETSWSTQLPSPWCNVFDNKSIQVMEYSEDLKYYWIDGYGYNLTYEQACPAVVNLVNYFSRNDTYPKAVLYFTHSGTILKLLAHLGLYRDPVPLQHDNFSLHRDRQWRVSKIDAFASNIAAILYKCGNLKKIQFLHQERTIVVAGCQSEELCDFNTFLSTYNKSIHSCNFNDMCHI
ncbi:Multiple inositol polyphosphate phosphatase 2 [Carabus blaptoides fortunei]